MWNVKMQLFLTLGWILLYRGDEMEQQSIIIHPCKLHDSRFCQGMHNSTKKKSVLFIFFIDNHLNGFNQNEWMNLSTCAFFVVFVIWTTAA